MSLPVDLAILILIKIIPVHRLTVGLRQSRWPDVDLVEEREIGDSPYRFEGGDAEIVAVVQHEMAVARGML